MALTTTAGAADADSYATLVWLAAYHAARGNAAWAAAATDTLREQAARRAAAWIDGRYRDRFPGSKTGGRAQALEWPRTGATDAAGHVLPDDEIPVEILTAQAEAALHEITAPGALYPQQAAGGAVLKRRKVGPIELEYDTTAAVSAPALVVTSIDDILGSLVSVTSAGGGMVPLLRA